MFNLVVSEKLRIFRLNCNIFSNVTFDFPILHQSRSNAVLILSVPSSFSIEAVRSFVSRMTEADHDIVMIEASCIVVFRRIVDAECFYIRTHGIAFSDDLPSLKCISLFLNTANLPDIDIITTNTGDQEVLCELPICPVCFQLIDPLTNGFFSQMSPQDTSEEAFKLWGHDCEVCRRRFNHDGLKCECGKKTELWICLQCGHIGCDRKSNQHALKHYNETGHRFTMLLDNDWVWDYQNDQSAENVPHPPPSQQNIQVIEEYRKSFSRAIMEIHDYETRSKEQIDSQFTEEMKSLQEELKLRQESYTIEREIEEITKEINAIRTSPLQTEYERLRREDRICTTTSQKLGEKINEYIEILNDAPDLSSKLDYKF